MVKERYNELGAIILDAAITVHRELGPGLLESVYQYAMIKELELRNVNVTQKIAVPLIYKGFDTGKYLKLIY
jgi:GxxExxY protein